MYPQSCGFLPNKKQSAFNSTLPHNIGLLRNFSSQSFPKFDSVTHTGVSIKPTFKDLNAGLNQHRSRSASIIDFMYSFSDSSKIKMRESLLNGAAPTEKSKHSCKQLLSHYNTVTQMPLLSSQLVGGFVGSKSQLGRRPTHGFGVNMWDIIRELVGVFGNSSDSILKKGNTRKSSFTSKKCLARPTEKENSQETQINMSKNSNSINNRQKLKDAHSSPKQSYADVAKIKLELPLTEKLDSATVFDEKNSNRNCNSMLKNFSICKESDNRNRIPSECSIDSEDSFIVFEYCEGDNLSIADDDCSNSDEESVVDFQVKNEESCTDNASVSLNISGPTRSYKSSRKKVQFAKGKDLVEVHPMVTWDYAYRAARRGPWEILARDSARFRYRIAKTEAILSPILDPKHREAVFQQRFASSYNGT